MQARPRKNPGEEAFNHQDKMVLSGRDSTRGPLSIRDKHNTHEATVCINLVRE